MHEGILGQNSRAYGGTSGKVGPWAQGRGTSIEMLCLLFTRPKTSRREIHDSLELRWVGCDGHLQASLHACTGMGTIRQTDSTSLQHRTNPCLTSDTDDITYWHVLNAALQTNACARGGLGQGLAHTELPVYNEIFQTKVCGDPTQEGHQDWSPCVQAPQGLRK